MDLTEKVNVPELQKVVAIIVAGVPLADIVKRTVPSSTDLLGKRMADRVERCFVKTAKMIEDAGVNPQQVEDKLVIAILRAASLEQDEDLHTMWAALLANAALPENAGKVRPSFIAVLKQMAHDEASLLNWIFKYCARPQEGEDQSDPSASEVGFLELKKAWVELGFASEASFEHFNVHHQDVQQFIVCRERLAATGLIGIPADDDTVCKLTLFGCQFIESCNAPERKP
jgi:hypothetical protein